MEELIDRYGTISEWNVSMLTDMEDLFKDLERFDEPIGQWKNAAAIRNMTNMFNNAYTVTKNRGVDTKETMESQLFPEKKEFQGIYHKKNRPAPAEPIHLGPLPQMGCAMGCGL